MARLVTIAIPTYNRAATLERAIASALAQTHERLEVLVSDNASSDATGELLAGVTARDHRVRVVRHAHNAGMVANLEAALRAARGDYAMLLADDDWLASRCVEATLAELAAHPAAAGALGRVRYMRDGREAAVGQPVALTGPDPARRVRRYFDAVGEDHGNSWMYALMPRAVVAQLSPMRNVLGFDWLHVAELAFLGEVRIVDEPLISRELGGISATTARNVRSSGLPALHARVPHLVIAREVAAEIGRRSPVYAPLGRPGRLALAAACAAAVPRRNARHLLFHLAPGCAAAALARARMTTLTFGIDGRAGAEEGAGGGRVVRELLRAFAARDDGHRYRIFARRAWDEPLDERFSWELIGARDPLWHVLAARAADRSCDAFVSTNSYLTASFMRRPCVPMVFDLVAFDPALRPQRRSGLIERVTLRPAVRRSAALVAISEATAQALVARYPGAAGKLVVAPLAASPALARTGGRLPDGVADGGFVLAVGTLEPRKNLPRLVDAYRRLAPALQAAHPLVVTGRLGWEAGETLAALDSLGDRVVRTGFVPDEALAELYRRCAVFAYPSLGEGFGLPVLEAMAAGAAVLTSDRSSLPEVGGDAVAYCDPTDTASIARELARLLTDGARRDDLRRRAPRRAAQFTWERTAVAVLDTLERVSCDDRARR